jgi:hypothetical protein
MRDFRLGQILARRRLEVRFAQVALGRALSGKAEGRFFRRDQPGLGPAGELALEAEHRSAALRTEACARERLAAALRERAALEILERRHAERLIRRRRRRETRELEETNAVRAALR